MKQNFPKLIFKIMVASSYFLLGLFFANLLIGNKLDNYLHQRMHGYVVFACLVLFLLAMHETYELFLGKLAKEIAYHKVAVFLIPIAMLSFNPTQLSSQVLKNKNIQIAQSNPKSLEDITQEVIAQRELELETESIPEIIYEDAFVDIYRKISESSQDYTGQTITVEGFVYREDTFSSNNIVVGRLRINCCAADAFIIGFMCRYEAASELESNSWVKVTGQLLTESVYYEPDDTHYEMLVLEVSELHSIEPYETPYVAF